MSKSLVPAESQELDKASPGMTLLQGYQMLSGDTPAEYQMDDDELDALDDVKIRPTRIKMDGTNGEFSIVGNTDVKPRGEIQAVVLDKLDNSQVFFPELDQEGRQVWPPRTGDADWPKFICRADSIHGVPRLHPELNAAQRQYVLELKVGGAVGGNCVDCPMAQFRGDEKPRCSGARNLLVFDDLTREPSVLQVKGTSIKGCDRHLAEYKKKRRVLYADLVTIGSKPEAEGIKKWKIMTFTRGPEAGTDAAANFREIRRTMTPLLLEEMRSGRNVMLGSDDELVHEEPPVAAPVGDVLPPVGALDSTGMMPGDLF